MTPNRSPEVAELYAALSKFHSKVLIIAKESSAHKHKYASLSDILREIQEPLAENHLEYTQEFIPGNDGHNILRTTLVHYKSKQWIESCVILPHPQLLGGSNINQDIGSSITYFRRYALSALLGLSSDEDSDGEVVQQTAGGASEKQIGYLKMLLRNKKMPEDSILKQFGVESLEQLDRETVRALIDKLK